MFPLQLELGFYSVLVVVFALFVGLPMLGVTALLARWGRLGTQLALLRRRLGMSRPVGWAVALVSVAGLAVAFAAGGTLPEESDFAFALAAVLYVGGVLVVGWALARRDHYRLVRETATTDAGGYADPGDVVEFEGEAVAAGDPPTGPVTGEPALAYRYRVDDRRWMGRRSSWVPVDHGGDAVRFAVDDGSGSALVDPGGARLDLRDTERVRVDEGEAPPPAAGELVERVDAVDEDDRVRFTERRLAPGDTVYVLGEVVDRVDEDGEVVTVVGDGETPLVVADHPEEALQRRLRLLVAYGGPGGAVAAVLGFGLLLWLAGAV